MFRVKLPAYETYRNATRPFVYASLRGVLDAFNLNQDVRTYFNDEAESSRMIGTTFTKEKRSDQDTDVGFEERQYIEVNIEDAEANTEMDSSHRHLVNDPLWFEPVTGSAIAPLYETKKVEVTINRYFPDKVLAQRFITGIKSGLKGQPVQQFSASVHYPILHNFLECMCTIYERLVAADVIDGTKINPLEWFKHCCTVPYDILSNMIGNNACFVFKRSVNAIKIRYQGIDIARVESKGKYNGQYMVSFSYSFYMAELKEWELYYPIMVYQQMTDQKYIPQEKQEFVDDYTPNQFYEGALAFGSERYMGWSAPDIFVFPPQDNWRGPQHYKMDDKLQRLAIMEDVEEQVVLNLFTFNGEETFWDDKFKEYLKYYHSKVTTRHKNPLYVTLWSDSIQVLDEQVSMDAEGNITLNRRPTMSAEYRVVLYFDYDVAKYDWDAIDDITSCDNETMGRWIMGVLFPYLPLPGDKEYVGRTPEGMCPWINWDDDVLDRLVPDDERGNGGGGNGGTNPRDVVQIHMSEGTIIAKNDALQHNEKGWEYLLTYDASKYLQRK